MLVLLSLAAIPLAAAPSLSSARACLQPGTEKVQRRGPAAVRKLGDMPPAKQVLAVVRSIDGCTTPAVVREEVGQPRP
jgi:hypothetical protein